MQLEQQNFRNANIGPSYMPGVLKNGTTSVEFIIQKLYVPTSLGHPHVFKTEPPIQQNSAEFSRIQVHLEIGSVFSHGAIQSALYLYFAPSWECSRAPPKKQRMERHVASARKCFFISLNT